MNVLNVDDEADDGCFFMMTNTFVPREYVFSNTSLDLWCGITIVRTFLRLRMWKCVKDLQFEVLCKEKQSTLDTLFLSP